MSFDKELANPENVVVELKFLDKENIIKGSARKLLVQAFDSEMIYWQFVTPLFHFPYPILLLHGQLSRHLLFPADRLVRDVLEHLLSPRLLFVFLSANGSLSEILFFR